jgi:hypothetical protein
MAAFKIYDGYANLLDVSVPPTDITGGDMAALGSAGAIFSRKH